ncbi:MAG: response regulator [Mycobacteriales bacterium]
MNPRILLAEDNEDHAFFTVRAFQDVHGAAVEIETVRDGEEALDYLHRRGRFSDRSRPHLIVLDLKMPKLSGHEVLSAVKTSPELQSIPIVVFSSSDREEDVTETYRRGGNSYVTKPTSPPGLREGVRGLARYWMEVATLPSPPE